MDILKNSLVSRISNCLRHPYLSKVLIGLGVLLRTKHFLENRSLRLDEAALFLTLTQKSAEYNPSLPIAPIGFLTMERYLIGMFGPEEWVLRLVPFIASLIGLFLFYRILPRFVSPLAIPLALGLVIFSKPMIFYAADFKPYAVDVLAVIGLLCNVDYLIRLKFRWWQLMMVALWGMVILWYSYPSVFMVGALVLGVSLRCVRTRDWERLGIIFGLGVFWALNFVWLYFMTVKPVAQNTDLHGMWRQGFMPVALGWSESMEWIGLAFKNAISYMLGIPSLGGFLLMIFGVMALWKTRRDETIVLGLMVLLPFLTAVMGKYPFQGRLILFLSPVLAIFTAEGVAVFFRQKRFQVIGRSVGILAVVFLLFGWSKSAFDDLTKSHDQEQIRPVMLFLKKYFRRTDTIYLNNSAFFGLVAYQRILEFPYRIEVIGRTYDEIYQDKEGYFTEGLYERHLYDREKNFLALFYKKGYTFYRINAYQWPCQDEGRVWVLLSHFKPELQKIILSALDKRGKRLAAYETVGSAVYLYDLEEVACGGKVRCVCVEKITPFPLDFQDPSIKI